MPTPKLWYPRFLFFLLFIVILISSISVSASVITAKYSFNSNFYIYINIRPDVASKLCHKQLNANNVYYILINPNETTSIIKIGDRYLDLSLKINNITIFSLDSNGNVIDKCRTNLNINIKYDKSSVIMPVYNRTIAGGFPYVGIKKTIGNTIVLIVSLGTRDFEIETPSGIENSTMLAPGNVLSVSPTTNSSQEASEVVKLFKEVLDDAVTIHAAKQGKNLYVVEAFPKNSSIVGLLAYGLILGSPPGKAYSYGNISVPASLVSSYSVASSNLEPTVFKVGSYKCLYYNNNIYFMAHGARKTYIVSLSILPPVLPSGNVNVYDVSYRWDNGLLLNASFRWFAANIAVQGFILEGPVLDLVAVDSAVYGVIYGIVPPGTDPQAYLEKLVSNPLGSVMLPTNAYFNVHLVEYNVENPQVTTVSANGGGGGSETAIILVTILVFILLGAYVLYKRSTK